MRTFAEKPKTTQSTTSAKASSVSRAHVGQGHDPHSILDLQRTIGNQAVNRLLRTPAGASKPPVPKPGHTPFNFISESPALENWKVAVKEMLEREFKMKFGSFEEAQEHFRKHLQGLPSDSAREDFADRMKDRARKAFYRKEGRAPSYAYKPEDIPKLKGGTAPESGMQLEHMEDVKSKKRGGKFIKGRPERALDPGNIYVTEGGPGGTAPRGTKHAEKYRTIEATKKNSLEVRERATKTAVEAEGTTTKASARPPTATTIAPPSRAPAEEPPRAVPSVKAPPASSPVRTPAPAVEGPSSAVAAPPVRPTSVWKVGLKAGGKALGVALIFAGLDYLVRRQLHKDLEESIDKARHGAMGWAQAVKRKDPSKPVYMRVKVESRDYSQFVPFLGWMPETPVLHVIQIAMVREEMAAPLVEVQDHRFNIWRPGMTTTVTYTELMVP